MTASRPATPSVEFRALGPLEAWIDGKLVELRGAKQRALLSILLVHTNEVVSTERLVDSLWPESAPEGTRKALQVHISNLRRALQGGRSPGGSEAVETVPPGYRLQANPDTFDVLRFEGMLSEGRAALQARRPGDAAAVLRQALELWRGPAYADVAYESFAQTERNRLEELRLAATEELIDADLALGSHTTLVSELEALVVEHPLRERLTAQLMVALYRSGRQAEALRAYQRLRHALAEELGIDPSPALAKLEQDILVQSPELRTGEARSVRAVRRDPQAGPAARLEDSAGGLAHELSHDCERLTLGSAPENDLVVEGDPTVSRSHAVFERFGSGWQLKDLRSRNGTAVNDERITERFLRDGDTIRFGRTVFAFRSAPGPGGSTVPTSAVELDPIDESDRELLLEVGVLVVSGTADSASYWELAKTIRGAGPEALERLAAIADRFDVPLKDGRDLSLLVDEATKRGVLSVGEVARRWREHSRDR